MQYMQVYGKDKMFIDICHANGKEKDFLETSKKLGITGIFFVGSNVKPDFQIKNKPLFFGFEKPIQKNHICVIQNLSREKKFNSPMKINHVYFKELKENKCLVAVSINEILTCPESLEKIKFIVKLCRKYNIPVMIASFAKSVLGLRSKEELLAFARYLGLKKDVLSNFHNFLTQDF